MIRKETYRCNSYRYALDYIDYLRAANSLQIKHAVTLTEKAANLNKN